MEPGASTGRGGDQAAFLVALLAHHLALAHFPRPDADALRPAVGIALAFEAHQHGLGAVTVPCRIAAGRILGDEAVHLVFQTAEAGLDAAIARGSLVVERHLAIDDVGVDVAVQ